MTRDTGIIQVERRRRPRPERKDYRAATNLTFDEFQQLEALAEFRQWTVAKLLRFVIRRALEDNRPPQQQPAP